MATFHYSKGYESDRGQWYGNQAVASHPSTANVDSMMWPSTSTFGAGAGAPIPALGHAPYASSLVGLEGNSGSPILSSPPSSNASSSAQSSATSYGLMVPPTVPSHAFEAGNGSSHANNGVTSSLFELHHVAPLAPAKADSADEGRGYTGFESQPYASYDNGNAQLSAWSESNPTSSYVSSSPTPPPPAPHASESRVDAWQQSGSGA